MLRATQLGVFQNAKLMQTERRANLLGYAEVQLNLANFNLQK